MTNDCIPQPDGSFCRTPASWSSCRPWDLTQQPGETCFAEDLLVEAIQIAGANINIYKLLGIHEQTKLIDLIGHGNAISGGFINGFPPSNAFNKYAQEWRSKQSGAATLTQSYIGYDFGFIKLPNGRQRYSIDTNVRHQITAIKIKQSSNHLYRITKARIERSEDGKNWYGVAVVTLPDNDALNIIHFKESVPNRYWRIRPLAFSGTECDVWGVQALEMFDYSITDNSNIQDKVLFENRDRDYSTTPVTLRGHYDLYNVSTDLTRFGIEITDGYTIKIPFSTAVAALGRPVIIGDIVELPSETQYGIDLKPVKKYLEVSDVAWDANSYTPGWRPTMLLVTTKPALASQETQDIFGSIAAKVDASGLFDNDDGNNKKYQDFSNISQTIAAEAKNELPERGAEGANTVRLFEPEQLAAAEEQKFSGLGATGLNRTGVYVEAAMPPNNEAYTEGPVFPDKPINNQYHRLTYVGLASKVPAVLHRWSEVKNRWLYLETDRRSVFDDQKPLMQEYLRSDRKIPARKIK